jgi:hypothetical protein
MGVRISPNAEAMPLEDRKAMAPIHISVPNNFQLRDRGENKLDRQKGTDAEAGTPLQDFR